MVEVVGIEPTSEGPSEKEYHVRLLSVWTDTYFTFGRSKKLSVIFKSLPTNLLVIYFSDVSPNVFTSFLLSVLAPQVLRSRN